MDLIVQKNTIKLIRQIADTRTVTTPIIPYRPQKKAFVQKTVPQQLLRKDPESTGISSEHLSAFLGELQNDKSLDMHSVMIIRSGAVISEAYFGAYKKGVWRLTNSLCKSLTGIAIGMLIVDGLISLDTPITNLFDKKGPIISALLHKKITVAHLLTMSSGIVFNEAGSVTEEDWVKCFFESVVKFEPGTQFSYNSMNSYMLSAIVRNVSGKSLMNFLGERLFGPLGIENLYWETCPKGIEKGGWGLYLLPEDAAKLGLLYLQNGLWKGKRIISEEWIKTSVQTKIKTREDLGDFDYGYHLWVGRKNRKFLFNGMYGQNILGFFDSDIIIVTNAGNNEMFQQSSFYSIAEKYFGEGFVPSERLPHNLLALRRLRKLETNLEKSPKSFFKRLFINPSVPPKKCCSLYDRTYIFEDSNKSSGFFPLFAQILQNNYSSGIKAISFSLKNGALTLGIIENDETYEIPIGFSEAKYSDVNIHGDPYTVGAQGIISLDDNRNTSLSVRFSFIEIANSRTMKFDFIGDEIFVTLSEQPGKGQIKMYMSCIETMGKLLLSIFSIVDPDFLDYKIERIFEPVLKGKLDIMSKQK